MKIERGGSSIGEHQDGSVDCPGCGGSTPSLPIGACGERVSRSA